MVITHSCAQFPTHAQQRFSHHYHRKEMQEDQLSRTFRLHLQQDLGKYMESAVNCNFKGRINNYWKMKNGITCFLVLIITLDSNQLFLVDQHCLMTKNQLEPVRSIFIVINFMVVERNVLLAQLYFHSRRYHFQISIHSVQFYGKELFGEFAGHVLSQTWVEELRFLKYSLDRGKRCWS